jgi:branched-chain amino acid transport system permease protein
MDWGVIFEDTLRGAVGMSAILYAIAAIGLNVHFGYAGLVNFGQVAFMAAGSYGMAISVTQWDFPLWGGWLFGIVCAVVLALLLGVPTLRLRGDYLAIVTIAVGEIIRNVVRANRYQEVTGGPRGLFSFSDSFRDLNPLPDGTYGFPDRIPGLSALRYGADQMFFRLAGWGLVLLMVLVVWLLMRSPWGRVVKSLRDDEAAVRSLGKNAYGYKLQALVVGGVIGAVGSMFIDSADNEVGQLSFRPTTTFYLYVVLILGGAGRIWGPVVGSMLFWAIAQFIDGVLSQGDLVATQDVGDVRNVLIGAVLVVLVIWRPQGIFGDKREIALEVR